MIASAWYNVLYAVLYTITAPIRLLPNATLPSGVSNALSQAGSLINTLDAFIPVATILTIVGLVVAIEGGVFSYKVIMWVIRKIPGLK